MLGKEKQSWCLKILPVIYFKIYGIHKGASLLRYMRFGEENRIYVIKLILL